MPIREETARTNLETLLNKYDALTNDDKAALTEAGVVRQFIDILLRDVLGWPIEDPNRYKYELHTTAGRPDITLIPEKGGQIYIEAKRFGIIQQLEEARYTDSGVLTPGQLALPGMATDRTREEQQAINYAFENNATWAILTNFEKLRLFNARRDWLVLSFERPGAYKTDFDQLWQLSYERVLAGSLDQLSNQRWTKDIDTDYLSFINLWRERLAQDIISRPEANRWAFEDDGSINLPRLRAVVQRFLDRLVVIRFAEDHLVLPPGTLLGYYEHSERDIYFSLTGTLSTFFRRFDENHNSALFAEDVVDRADFSDDALRPLIKRLYDARYRSMPADIIGNTYEQYLGKALALDNGSVTTRDNLETRKKQGSYYTPQVIVRYIVDHSLGRYLYATANGQPDGDPIDGETPKTAADLNDLRVLDSACGSGSFLIYAYEVLAGFYERELARLRAKNQEQVDYMAANFDKIDTEYRVQVKIVENEIERLKDYPRIILEHHLYGVDLDPQAAEIAVVNLMMRAMERRGGDKRLPLILNQNVKVGNGLIGVRADDPRMDDHREALATIRDLRQKLIGTPNTDPRHDDIVRQLTEQTEAVNAALNADFAEHFSDLGRVRPFNWGVEFPEVFYEEDGTPQANAGFTVIVGNPPWEIVKPDLREFYAQFDENIESRMNRAQVEKRIEELNAEDPRREAQYNAQTTTIEESAAYFRATDDYVRQGRGDTATHKLFMERMYGLLGDAGRLGYVVPSGIYTDLGTKQLREMLLDEGSIQYIYSFSNERFFFPGVDHRVKFALIGAEKGTESDGFWATFRFNPRVAVAPEELPTFLADENNLFFMRSESVERFSPDSLSVMEFQSRLDYQIAEKLYSGNPLIGDEIPNSWSIKLNREFDMTNDRHLFNTNGGVIPVFNGRMIHQYDSAYAPHEYWVAESKIPEMSEGTRDQIKAYRVGYRRIARPTDTRTLIAALVQPNSLSDTAAIIENTDDVNHVALYVLAMFNSLTLDYVLRQKIATTVNMFYMYQLPVPRLTAGDPYFDAIVPRAARLTCTRPEFADLWETVMGTAWDESSGAADAEERQRLRDEIDALVAHLYGLERDEFDHILGTFPLVFPDDEAGRSRRAALLRVFDGIV